MSLPGARSEAEDSNCQCFFMGFCYRVVLIPKEILILVLTTSTRVEES